MQLDQVAGTLLRQPPKERERLASGKLFKTLEPGAKMDWPEQYALPSENFANNQREIVRTKPTVYSVLSEERRVFNRAAREMR